MTRTRLNSVGAASLVLALLGCGDDGGGESGSSASQGTDATSTTSSSSSSTAASSTGSESTEDSTGSGDSSTSGSSESTGATGDPVIVAVGYGGRRMRSLDLGLSWEDLVEDDPNGGDDPNLLRAATFADGLFVAVGWRIRTSPDGVEWTERTVDGQQWCGGVAHGNDLFVCAGGCGEALRSTNGTSWEQAGDATEGCQHLRTLAFGNGVFVAAGDDGIVSTTLDGIDWTTPVVEDIARVVFRDGEFVANGDGFYKTSPDGVTWTQHAGEAITWPFGHGVYVRGRSPGRIERSLDGNAWDVVFDDGGNSLSGFAFGTVPE